MSTCIVTGTMTDCSGAPLSGLNIYFNTQSPSTSPQPARVTTTSAANGTWSMPIIQGLSGTFTVYTASSSTGNTSPYQFNVVIPATSTATLQSIVEDQ
jgi:hypothetical protein